MDTLGQNYGFWIKPYDGMDKEKFKLIRSGVELVCRVTTECAKYLEIKNATMGMLLKTSPDGAIYLTVHLSENIVLFGIYNENEKSISNILDCGEYKKASYSLLEYFANRCEATLWAKKKEKYPAELKGLSTAWDAYIKENPVLIQKVKEAQTNNNVFLEQKDLEKKER